MSREDNIMFSSLAIHFLDGRSRPFFRRDSRVFLSVDNFRHSTTQNSNIPPLSWTATYSY